jgi:hypothetical protein
MPPSDGLPPAMEIYVPDGELTPDVVAWVREQGRLAGLRGQSSTVPRGVACLAEEWRAGWQVGVEERAAAEAAEKPPLDKGAALAAFVKELRGGALPDEILAEATAEDLAAAHAELLRITRARWEPGTFAGGEHYQLGQAWEYCPPEQRAKRFGAPALRTAIRRRTEAETAAVWQERLAAGFTPEICVKGAVIERMITRGLLTDADRENSVTVGFAAMQMIGLDVQITEAPAAPLEVSPNAPDPRREAAAVLFLEAMGLARLPAGGKAATADDLDRARGRAIAATSAVDLRASLAAPLLRAAILEREEREAAAAKAERLAAGVVFRAHLSGESIRRLPLTLRPMSDEEAEKALAAAVLQQIALTLDPPKPPLKPLDLYFAYAPSYVFAHLRGYHKAGSPARTLREQPGGPDYLP